MTRNLFTSTSRYAARQEENFLTESLVFVLDFLLERKEAIGTELLRHLGGNGCSDWFESPKHISLETQISVDEGRPDIVVTVDRDRVLFIEVKHDSGLGYFQLERYQSSLTNSQKFKETGLTLISRSRTSMRATTLERGQQYHHVCWYEISGWLSDAKIYDETAKYIVHQFLDFLKEKEMCMERITWEYIEGVPALTNLASMLGKAIEEAIPDEKYKRTAGWNWIGYYLGDENDIWIGVRYHEPLKVAFENNGGTNPTFKRELHFSQAHFFSLSAGEQLESLIGFIKDSYHSYCEN